MPRGFRLRVRGEIGAPGVLGVPQLPALGHARDHDLADAVAAARQPVGERFFHVPAHAAWTASKAATCSRITSAKSGSVPMALA